MKKLNILRLFSTVAIAAAGLFGVASLKQAKSTSNVAKVEAISTGEIYFSKPTWANGDTPWFHLWNGGGNWDQGMTFAFTNWAGESVYKGTPNQDATGFNIRFNQDGSGMKESVNLSNVTAYTGYYHDGTWPSSQYGLGSYTVRRMTFTYNGNGSTGGSTTSSTNFMPDNRDASLASNGFTRTGYVFAGWGTSATDPENVFSSGGKLTQGYASSLTNGSTVTLYAQWRKSYTSGRYLLNENLDMDSATLMTYSSSEYVATITLSYQQKIKSAWYNNDNGVLDNYYGYSRLYNKCGAYHYFSYDDADNIVCYARGAYKVYVNNDNISIELENSNVLTAEHLAAQLMSFGANPSSGHCGDDDRFPAMRTIYLTKLNVTEKSTFQGYASSSIAQFKNAYDRYTDWAKALGENPWAEGKANSPSILPGIASQSTNTVIMIVVISIVSVGAVGGYFFIRKRKED